MANALQKECFFSKIKEHNVFSELKFAKAEQLSKNV